MNKNQSTAVDHFSVTSLFLMAHGLQGNGRLDQAHLLRALLLL